MKNIPTAADVMKRAKMHPLRVKAIYIFGSRVYGTSSFNSDWDFIMVANNSVNNQEIRSGDFNIHIITPDQFQEDLTNHKIQNLECFFAPDWAKLLETIKWSFKLDLPKLRHSVSHVSSNAWVKCKKKLRQDDYYIGIKSIFHSIRIPMFGSQIARFGKIVDYSCANDIWKVIDSKEWTWVELDKNFRELYNSTLTEFRKFASK